MADLKKTVEIIFGAKNEVSKVVTDIGRNFETLGDLTGKITEPLAKIGDSILKIDAALLALAIGGMALAIKQSSEFNKSFALISTSITASGPELDKYREDVLNYSTTSVKSLADINASLYTAAQAGVKYTESLAFIRAAEQLSVANNANLNTTVDLLTGTMNAYGFTVKDVGKMNDVFFTSTLIGKQTIDELGTSMGQVVGIAANAGVSFEELNAAIATLTAKGMTTENAITAVKGVITTLIAPSKEAADAAKELGLNFSLTELTSKGFAGMLTEIMSKTGGSKEQMVGLFNEVRAMNGVLSLTGDGMKFFNSALDQTKNSAGNAEAAYQKMVATFSNQMQMVKNVAEVTMIDIGTRLEPMAAKIAGSFGALFAGVKIGVDAGAFDPLFKYLDQVSASLSTWLNGIAAAFPEALTKIDFTGLIAAFNDLGRAIGDYFGGLDLTKADDLASAMQLLIDIVAGIVRVTAGMADAFRPFVTVIVDFFRTLAKSGPETQETMGKILAFAQAIELFGGYVFIAIMAIDKYKLSIQGLFNVTAGGAAILWNGMQILFDLIMRGFLLMEGQLVSFLDTMTFGMFPGLAALKTQITQQTEAVGQAILQNGMEAGKGLDRMLDGFVQLGSETGTTKTKVEDLHKGLLDLPAVTAPEIRLTGGAESSKTVAEISKALVELPEKQAVTIEVLADGTSIETADEMITTRFPDGRILLTQVGVDYNDPDWINVQTKIDKAIPKKKTVDIETKLETEKFKAQADIIQKAVEWTAKIDIAQVEAETARLKTIFDSINTSIQSTGTTLASEIGSVASSVGTGTTGFIQSQIEAEGRRRDDALLLQKELITAEVDVLKKRAEALGKGEGIIKIESSNLAPHLEAFMYEILAAIQVKANAEGMKFLVGV